MSMDSSSSSATNSILTSPSSTNAPISTSPSSLSTTPRRILKPKRSLVWRYFNVINNDELNVECVLCSSTIIRKSTSTSNLLHHIQTQHNSEYQNINKSMKSKSQMRTTESTPRLPLSSERSVHLTKLIADFIIYNYLPLSIVESPQLQVIFQEAEPSYVIPSRKYFVNKIFQDMYSEIQQNAYNELQLAPGICLTTDIWTSQANQAYMTVTAHFVDLKNNKIKNFVLETKEFSGNHTAERIVERLNNLCIDWSISDKIVCLVTDTCNTMRKVGKDFGKGWIGCTDHLINLSVNDVIRKLDEVKAMLATVRYIVTFTRETHLAIEMLNKYQKSFGFIERNLIFDVKTRWNSTFYMLQRFIEEKNCVTACLNERLFQKHFINVKVSKVVEWDGLEQLLSILEPFEAATRKLASDSSPTIPIILPVITTLITSLEYRDADSSFQKKVKDNLRLIIQKRFEELYQDKLILLCSVLDPRWKDFSFLNRSLYQSHNETLVVLNQLQAFDARNLAYLLLEEQFNILFGNTSTVSQSNVQQPEQKKKNLIYSTL